MTFPFSAIVGQDAAKRSLLVCLVDPAVGGVLLLGEKGAGKSTLARSTAALVAPVPFVNLPVSASEEMLTGCLDVADSLRTGRRAFQSGVLERADKGILYIDEVNLLSDTLATRLVDAAATGFLRIEREGVSRVARSRFTLVASMNPEEGGLRPQLTDRFGMAVFVSGPKDLRQRAEIVRRRLAFDSDPAGFCTFYEEAESSLRKHVYAARRMLPAVRPTDRDCLLAATAATAACAAGHRGEILTVRVARSLAALDGRGRIESADIEEAALLTLAHRSRNATPSGRRHGGPAPQEAKPPEQSSNRDARGEPHQSVGDAPGSAAFWTSPPTSGTGTPDTPAPLGPLRAQQTEAPPSRVFEIAPNVLVPDPWRGAFDRRVRRGRVPGAGRRLRYVSDDRSGRYVRSRHTDGAVRDLAVDATLRAAVLRWVSTGSGQRLVRPEDLREKVRVRRSGGHIVFVVDASGSMAGARRMALAKGAVFSLLGESYRLRDTVAMISFQGAAAKVVLPPTRSVTLAHRLLRDIPTGGRTPLAEAIRAGCLVSRRITMKDPNADPVVVFVTDGRDYPAGPAADAESANHGPVSPRLASAARTARATGTRFVWIDTENPWVQVGAGRQLSGLLGAEYVRL